MKQYFNTRKEAVQVAQSRSLSAFKVKYGRHKNQYFVGTHLEYISFH